MWLPKGACWQCWTSWAPRICHCQLLLPSALGHWAWPGLIICVLSCTVTLCASVLNEDEGCPPWGSGNSLPTKQGLWRIARWRLCISGSVPSTPCPALQLPEFKAVDSHSVQPVTLPFPPHSVHSALGSKNQASHPRTSLHPLRSASCKPQQVFEPGVCKLCPAWGPRAVLA